MNVQRLIFVLVFIVLVHNCYMSRLKKLERCCYDTVFR
jgi:hypothetical protein